MKIMKAFVFIKKFESSVDYTVFNLLTCIQKVGTEGQLQTECIKLIMNVLNLAVFFLFKVAFSLVSSSK